MAHRAQRKEQIMSSVSPEARAVLKRVNQLQREARKASYVEEANKRRGVKA